MESDPRAAVQRGKPLRGVQVALLYTKVLGPLKGLTIRDRVERKNLLSMEERRVEGLVLLNLVRMKRKRSLIRKESMGRRKVNGSTIMGEKKKVERRPGRKRVLLKLAKKRRKSPSLRLIQHQLIKKSQRKRSRRRNQQQK